MKNCKKWLACMGAMLSLLLVLPVNTMAAGNPELTMTLPQTVEAGKQFALPVGIKNNPGWSAFQMEITYDPQQMALVGLDSGDAMNDYNNILFSYNENPVGTIHAIGLYNDSAKTVEESGNMEANGTLFTLFFQVKETVSKGTNIQVSLDLQTMCNAKLESQMDPVTVKASGKVGTLSASDQQTQPNKTTTGTGALSGIIGTVPAGMTSGNNATTGNRATNGITTAGSGQSNTNTAASSVSGQTAAASATNAPSGTGSQAEEGFGWWWIAIALAVLIVVLVVVIVTLKKRRY